MKLPSVATISKLVSCPKLAKEIRQRMESIINGRKIIAATRAEYLLQEIESAIESARQADDSIRFQSFGVEYIPTGSNKKSPSIWYLNTGGTYEHTFLILDCQSIRIGSWGDIVEKGNYE